jgi:RND family efflux transporter MFP subunit
MKTIVTLMTALFAAAWVAPGAFAQTNNAEPPIVSRAEGVVVAARSYDISAELDNKINRLHFVEGQLVKKGDLLVEFDTGMKKIEVAVAKAAYERAKLLAQLKKEEFLRSQTLKRKNVVSEAKTREAELNAAIATADMRRAELGLTTADLILKFQKLYAPFDGQMSAPRYRENANVDIDQGSEIATIVQLDPIHVRFSVPYARLAARMQAGESEAETIRRTQIKIKLPDGSSYQHLGKPVSAAFDLNPKTGMAVMLAVFPNPDRVLRPGLRVVGEGIRN